MMVKLAQSVEQYEREIGLLTGSQHALLCEVKRLKTLSKSRLVKINKLKKRLAETEEGFARYRGDI